MTGLRNALHDLADEAPQIDLSGEVVAVARRRRRVRVAGGAAATAGVVVAATLVAGSLKGEGVEPAPPVSPPSKDYVNTGPLPGPLPSGPLEPVKYAYLDWCKQPVSQSKTPPTGDCAQWRVVGRSGKQWRIADGLGVYPSRATQFNGSAPLKISDDGRRIAYYRPADERFVIRDLIAGTVTVLKTRIRLIDLRSTPAQFMFSADGTRLAVSWHTPGVARAILADTTSGEVRALPGKWVVGLGQDASTVTLADTKANGRTTLLVTGPDGRLRSRMPLDPRVHLGGTGNMVGPDGHTLIVLPGAEKTGPTIGPAKPLDAVKLVDVRTGKVIGSRTLRLPKEIAHPVDVAGWAGPSTIFLAGPLRNNTEGSPDRNLFTMGDQSHLVDLNTGRAKPFASVRLLASQTDSGFGGFTHKGG